ncbi:MAG TPA: ABC transporter permease [Thermomicrobiales bacterium]|jgi:ABC-type dipeptide/oligopeptide/nickel transport system permease subunit|nr:ABC transporter permease [Thermomicrobiales bacterium]
MSVSSATTDHSLGALGERLLVRQPRSALYYASRRFFRQKLAMVGLVITIFMMIIGFGAPLLAPTGYAYADLMSANEFPNRHHLLGTDAIGHDFLSRVMYGTRTSLIVGFASVFVACLIGMPLGLVAGLYGGKVDFFVMRIVEVMTAFPGLLFAIFLMTVTGSGLRNIIFVIGVTSWVTICRLMRAQLLRLREQEFVTAARGIGANGWTIAVRHLLPNAIPPLIVTITLAIPLAIFAEAGLSYLGIGINEPTPSLGKMVADSAPYIRVYWHLGLFPTLAIALIMLGFTFVGDGLRDALDPRQT